jgi:hypothetical protein
MLIGFEILFFVLPILLWLYSWCVPNCTRDSTDKYFCFYCIWFLYSVTVLTRVRYCAFVLVLPRVRDCNCTRSCTRLYLLVCATVTASSGRLYLLHDCTYLIYVTVPVLALARDCTRVSYAIVLGVLIELYLSFVVLDFVHDYTCVLYVTGRVCNYFCTY